jgi:hypothetical protein
MLNAQKKPHRVSDDWVTPLLERMLQWIGEWPAMAHVCVAAILTPAFFWFYVQKRMSLALVILVASIVFAYCGIATLYREWHYLRAIEQFSKGRTAYRHREMEHLVSGIYHLQGYKVRPAVGDLARRDVDLVAEKGKKTILIQFNHWNEDTLQWKSIEAPHRAALELKAAAMVIIAFGHWSENIASFVALKEVILMDLATLRDLANQAMGMTAQ